MIIRDRAFLCASSGNVVAETVSFDSAIERWVVSSAKFPLLGSTCLTNSKLLDGSLDYDITEDAVCRLVPQTALRSSAQRGTRCSFPVNFPKAR